MDLRLLRISKRLSIVQVARHMGIARSNAQRTEASARPTQRMVARYVAAIHAAEAER